MGDSYLRANKPIAVGYTFGDGIDAAVPDWHECFEGLLDGAKVISFTEGDIEMEMPVERRHTNL